MNEDVRPLIIVFVVWAAIALAYAFVPMLEMAGYAFVWGAGAVLFLGLAVTVALAVRHRGSR